MQTPNEALIPLRLLSLALLVLGAFIGTSYTASKGAPILEREPEQFATAPLDDVVAESYAVVDIKTGQLILARNEKAQLPLASVTKVMTAIVASELNVDRNVNITASALASEGDSGLFLNEAWPVEELINFMMVGSSNDAATALGELSPDFIGLMNDKARELGLSQTHFLNTSGLDEGATLAGGYGSAQDMAELIGYAVSEHPDVFSETRKLETSYSSIQFEHQVRNTNVVVDESLGLIASKTGFTDLAGGNLVVVFDAAIGRPVAIAVLGSTISDRFNDVRKLANASIDLLNSTDVEE